ncbi:MAG TPA: histidine kinase [Anaerolineales bacterium]|nr:histidine kinase [Anaerolineales bacterium]
MINLTSNQKNVVRLLLVALLIFLGFCIIYENQTLDKRQRAVEAYAGVISNSLWHFEPQAPTDYLSLIVADQDYERIQVLTSDGIEFVDVRSEQPDAFTNLLVTFNLIRRVELQADVDYRGVTIGEINAIWLNKNIYTYFYALLLTALSTGVFWLYWRILISNRELEMRVGMRTAELNRTNIELGESEARYRSIFEDSPISLREEDFSEVKKIVDQLFASGVKDLLTYFEEHPQVLFECVQAVRVLNVNQNTLELYKADSKERLYQGLAQTFLDESLVSFGQQIGEFAQGKTRFDCETVQQTFTGEKLWVATSISIAPGYEKTWEKAFVSILDITMRKKAEFELANYRGHLEELVDARTTELVALQHDLEQRVVERTEELAQVNIGLSSEIEKGKRLQDEVQRYAVELEQRVADRTRELSILYDVTAVASNVFDLDELLSRLLDRSLSAMRRKAGIIQLLDGAANVLRTNTQQGVTTAVAGGIAEFFTGQDEIRSVFRGNSSLTITDLCHAIQMPPSVCTSEWKTYIGVQIQDTRGELLGILSIFSDTDDALSVEEMTLLVSIADHIGLAVENVRLRRQAEETAVLEDRQRLARELHDSVNQSLFSASVIAESLPRLWQRDPSLVQQNLGDLHRLIRGAMAEMRILLLELRPVSMADAVLADLLQHLVNGLKGRTQMEIDLLIEGQCEIPIQIKKNLFRIAQEALNNIVKHSRASKVLLQLEQCSDDIRMRICDDGQGFELDAVEGGHLGLQIMHERAGNIGAGLEISSHFGAGTEILVVWPGKDKENDGEYERADTHKNLVGG